MEKIIFIVLALIFSISCEKDNNENSRNIDSIDLSIGDCYSGPEQTMICLDTVLNDSRCLEGAECIWEGNSEIRLDFTLKNGEKYKVQLNTNPDFQIDTTIDYLYVVLRELTPYPDINTTIMPEDYKAKLTIANINKLKSNAELLGFNPDKCGCCWGWTIKIGNDTIKSDDTIIGETVGYNINYPVNVYIELGELEKTCTEQGGMDYYDIKQIIKTRLPLFVMR